MQTQSTIADVVTILTARQKPLAEKLKALETIYKAERGVFNAQLQPINKA
jgi:hypothetical protein